MILEALSYPKNTCMFIINLANTSKNRRKKFSYQISIVRNVAIAV